jgi:hypothetical protein
VSAAELVASFLSDHEIAFRREGSTFTLQLSGEHKRSLPVALTVRERTLSLEAFFLRRPIDNAAEVYRMLLSRNMRAAPVRFAADADGDVYLVGETALDGLDAEAVDALLGATLAIADEMFRHAVELGFASYLERERAYRAQQSDA